MQQLVARLQSTKMYVVSTPDSIQISSPSSLSSDASASGQRKVRCPICGDVSYNRHFGIPSCNSCAAFFRRTISMSRRYACVKGKQCLISFGDARHICIKKGMNISAVFVRSTDEFSCFEPDSPLRKILLAQRSTFVNRYASLLKHYGGNPALVKMGSENPPLNRTVATVASEFSVLNEYLMATGFKDFDLSSLQIQQLSRSLFYPWMAFHSIMGVLRNAGHKTNVAFFVDESHVKVTDDAIKQYVRMLPDLLDYRTMETATNRFFKNTIDVANQLHSTRMEENEHSAIFHVYALRTASRLFPQNRSFDGMINSIFHDLTRHFQKNYDSVPLKLGNMILMLTILERATATLSDFVTLLYINGYNPVLSKLSGEETPVKPI
ncbi:Transcription factor HNF-4-like protein [Aphelenchoides besseyi]|nr:Transcription factor HNF-4-like protein [Aphelenchoides besseyi]